MSKKGIKSDDLLELFNDDRVIEALSARLKPHLVPTIEETSDERISKFMHKLESLVEQFTKDVFAKFCEAQGQKMESLESENKQLRMKIDEVENSSRLNNVVIHGLAESPQAGPPEGQTETSHPKYRLKNSSIPELLDLCNNRLHVQVIESDISFSFRITTKGTNTVRPLVVGFSRRVTRDMIFASRKLLRGEPSSGSPNVYINEHLTRTNSQIFARTRNLVRSHKIHSTWTAGGRVFLRQSESSLEKPMRVDSLDELQGF